MTISALQMEFSADRVYEKKPHELGRYIGHMKGSREDLMQIVALVAALQKYDRDDSENLETAFNDAFAEQLDDVQLG